MFHSSNTIWHNHSGNNFSNKEKRLVFGVIGETWKGVKEGAGYIKGRAAEGGKHVVKAANWWPIKFLFPLGAVYKFTAEKAAQAYKGAKFGVKTGIEAGKGIIGKEHSIGRGFFDLGVAPIDAIYRLFTKNFRSVIKGVFQTPYELGAMAGSSALSATKKLFSTPYNLIRHPIDSLIGMKNSVVKTVTGVRNKTAHILDDVMHFHIGKLAKETRDSVVGALKAPFKAIAKPWEAITKTPKEIGRNFIDTKDRTNPQGALDAYPRGVHNWIKGIREGVTRIMNAPNTVSAGGHPAAAAAAAAH